MYQYMGLMTPTCIRILYIFEYGRFLVCSYLAWLDCTVTLVVVSRLFCNVNNADILVLILWRSGAEEAFLCGLFPCDDQVSLFHV